MDGHLGETHNAVLTAWFELTSGEVSILEL